jgi:drug/metabolite transporter (DMT)-like permease
MKATKSGRDVNELSDTHLFTCLPSPGLPHSLLLVSSSPVILTVAYCLACRPLSLGEIAGVALGSCGAALLALSSKSDQEVTALGDGAAFLAAAAFCVYITCGKSLQGAIASLAAGGTMPRVYLRQERDN